MMENYNLPAKDANRIIIALVMFEIFFVVAYGFTTFFHIPIAAVKSLFDLDTEGSLPAWFSSTQLFLIGLVFLIKGYLIDRHHSPSPYFFFIVAIGFIFLSADEAAAIHEKTTATFKHIQDIPRFKGNHGIWIFLYLPVVLLLLLTHVKYVIAMWKHYRQETIILSIGMAALICGGVLLEIISYQFLRTGLTPVGYFIEVMAEEFLEMFGATIVLYGAILTLLKNPTTA
jgi:hypothetical protein